MLININKFLVTYTKNCKKKIIHIVLKVISFTISKDTFSM